MDDVKGEEWDGDTPPADPKEFIKDPEVNLFEEEIETGIFNLVITLCQKYAQTMPMEDAKKKTSQLLGKLAAGLNLVDDDTQ